MPRHLLEGRDISLEEYTRNPVGTGPFRFVQWDGGQKIVLEANDAYFEGRPNIDRFVYRVIPDSATQFLELKSGGVDSMGLTPGQYKLQAGTPFFVRNFQRFRYPSFGYTYIGYNLRNPLFTDVRVRRALTHAINKEDIIKVVLMGLGRPCTGPFPPESWAYNPDVPDPAYDPARARALLADAGFAMGEDGVLARPDGSRLSFTVMTNHGNDKRVKAAQIIKEQLRAVGVEINIKIVEWQAMLELIDRREFEAVMLGWALSRDPDLYEIWHSSKTGKREFNFVSFANAEVDRLIVEGRQTFDLGRRAEVYRRIHEILAEEQPYTFLYVPDALPIVHARFKGIEQSAIGIWYDLIHWRVPANRAEWYQ
jgi:peptide/nickel transport system substrate-binding protein